jgi:myosin-1
MEQEAVGLNKSARLAVFKLVAAVLFLGNITFGESGGENAFIEENGMAERAAALLGTDAEGLKAALVTKTVEAAGESIRGSNNMDQAKKVRDALAKALYDKLFEWLITVVNDALEAAQSAITQVQDSSGERLYIGVLDIYGFEIFDRNGFEQLCINYVNEQLQQIFIEQVLRAEQEEYAREGIQWQPIKFFNNKIVVDLIDSVKVCAVCVYPRTSASCDALQPPGIFSILNDVCATMHAVSDGADAKFIDKVNAPLLVPRSSC